MPQAKQLPAGFLRKMDRSAESSPRVSQAFGRSQSIAVPVHKALTKKISFTQGSSCKILPIPNPLNPAILEQLQGVTHRNSYQGSQCTIAGRDSQRPCVMFTLKERMAILNSYLEGSQPTIIEKNIKNVKNAKNYIENRENSLKRNFENTELKIKEAKSKKNLLFEQKINSRVLEFERVERQKREKEVLIELVLVRAMKISKQRVWVTFIKQILITRAIWAMYKKSFVNQILMRMRSHSLTRLQRFLKIKIQKTREKDRSFVHGNYTFIKTGLTLFAHILREKTYQHNAEGFIAPIFRQMQLC
jgi:hypothetical protein